MPKPKNEKRTAGILLTLILAGEVIFFLPFVLARIFRPTLLVVFLVLTLFSIVGLGMSLLFGRFADKTA